MHLKLIQCGGKLPADLFHLRLAHSQARPAGSGPSHARRRALPSRAEPVFLLFARRLLCALENDFITITRRRRSIHP